MYNRLNIFKVALKPCFNKAPTTTRKLYTDSIYPYPHKYFDKLYASKVNYRETWTMAWWDIKHNRIFSNFMKVFWTYWWWMLFNDPGAILGHFTPPDPTKWTDKELGIPADDEGSYTEWVEKKMSEIES